MSDAHERGTPETPLDIEDAMRPDGLAVRRMRHERGWSPRALIDAIARASESATGIANTISPSLLAGIEEHDEEIPHATLCLVAAAFDCDPVDLWSSRVEPEDDEEEHGAGFRRETG